MNESQKKSAPLPQLSQVSGSVEAAENVATLLSMLRESQKTILEFSVACAEMRGQMGKDEAAIKQLTKELEAEKAETKRLRQLRSTGEAFAKLEIKHNQLKRQAEMLAEEQKDLRAALPRAYRQMGLLQAIEAMADVVELTDTYMQVLAQAAHSEDAELAQLKDLTSRLHGAVQTGRKSPCGPNCSCHTTQSGPSKKATPDQSQ